MRYDSLDNSLAHGFPNYGVWQCIITQQSLGHYWSTCHQKAAHKTAPKMATQIPTWANKNINKTEKNTNNK